MSFPKYAVSEAIVLHIVYNCEFLPEYAKKSGGSEKGDVWNLGSLIVPLCLGLRVGVMVRKS